jgi:hypothetical protein
MPTLSIIIPTFNSAATIQRCLGSIRVQTFTDYEILLQDGGSTDRTVELIEEFRRDNSDKTLELEQEPDKGVYDAMNKGMRRARGEWLYFLGSDDELHDCNVLSAMVGSSDADKCTVRYGNALMIPEGCPRDRGLLYDGPFDLRKMLNHNICHQAIFYRRDFLRQVGEYDLRYPICGDWDLNLRCWGLTSFTFVEIVVVDFAMGGISTIGRGDKCFERGIAERAMNDFGLSICGPSINTWDFYGIWELVKIQQSRGAATAFACRCLRRLYRSVGRIRHRAGRT